MVLPDNGVLFNNKQNERTCHEKKMGKQNASYKMSGANLKTPYDSNYLTFWKTQNYGDK